MRRQEAAWIGEQLAGVDSGVVLDVGSGSRHAREVGKPYIHGEIFAPLLRRGVRVVHTDLKPGEGVDISGDLFDPALQARLRELQPKAVLACNILEHLPKSYRERFPAVLDTLLPPGGLLIITVPYSYPYHADPIDTLYRPSPEALCASFPGYEVLEARTIASESYGDEFVAGGPLRMVRKVLRMFFPFVRPKRWFSHAHRMLWLFRPYRLTGAVLRKR
ncbi:MAG TPA: hypothetical protein VM183_18420 [Burkholderiales bacterium]|nr:hypothetical protein [Burkholderiales bacterium]